MKIVLVYNPKSGSALSLRQLRALCRKAKIAIDYSFTVNQLNSKKLESLINKGVTVAVVGGDGTVNSVAGLVVGTKSQLLALPGGTLNHFVSDLGMPDTIEQVLMGAKAAKTKTIDVGYVNKQLFLNNVSIGLYPQSLIERQKSQRFLGKWPAAAKAILLQVVRFRRYKLLVDGAKVQSPFVFVGNNPYRFQAAGIPKRQSLNGGNLGVMISLARSRFQLIKIAVLAIKESPANDSQFSSYKTKKMRIDSHYPKIAVSFDGEVRKFDMPLLFHCQPQALNILHVKMSK